VSLVPGTLFGKTAVTLAVAFLYFAVFTFTAVVYYVQVPVAREAADDLAAFLVMVGRTWAILPPFDRERYAEEMLRAHDIAVSVERGPLAPRPPYRPFLSLVEAAIERRTGVPATLATNELDGMRWYWLELESPGVQLRVGFPESRLATRLPTALITVLLGSAALVLVTAMSLARRITKPLSLLGAAAERIGRGQLTEPLPEKGPAELAALIRQFNSMAHQVRDLLANRTTLLAGISHDLRTPLARLRIAMEMLPAETDPALLDGARRDLEEMNRLIGEALELGRGLAAEVRERVDLSELVGAVVEAARQLGSALRWSPPGPCPWEVNVPALRRVLDNLVGNAQRYGQGAVVTVELHCSPSRAVIRVLDRGPGIPPEAREAVFRPFFRLEGSRCVDTGGSGLGLAITRQLADANDWQVELLDREGGGLVAQVTLPAGSGATADGVPRAA
jgi:two-component system osmolarity sensor histidine kinase EnvZ